MPSETSDAIDLGAIDEDTRGLVIPYKDNYAVGYIAYAVGYIAYAVGYIAYACGETNPWAFFNTMDNTIIVGDIQSVDYAEESLTDLVKRLVKDKIADSFKLINFTIDLDNYNPDKLSSDNKKLMNKKNVWSL